MLLKRLEISGFKSFAKPTTLEFPTKIAAIVGPNGSGKSNIADAIRWVLGEQSMKHLRGKKGEDLIFGGGGESGGVHRLARLAKASATLIFDNPPARSDGSRRAGEAGKNKIFPVEFNEVALSRRVYRDGDNDYVLNDSQVRLKDIIELLSKVGLGASQHHIIAQGDADRILYASPKERKSMIEEALGLRIFELKKNEALRKLDATENNIKQMESLRRELAPHLKYLSAQAEKMKSAALLREDLDKLEKEYAARELKTLAHELAASEKEKTPLGGRVQALEKEIRASEEALGREGDAEKFFAEIKKLDTAQDAVSKKRRELEREAGRLEASSSRLAASDMQAVPKDKIKSVLMELVLDLESVSKLGTMEAVRNTIFTATQKIYRFLESINVGSSAGKISPPDSEILKANVAKLEREESEIARQKNELQKNYEARAVKIQREGALLRNKMEDLARAKDALRNVLAREEKIEILRKEFELDFGQLAKSIKPAGLSADKAEDLLTDVLRNDFRKKIERFRIRLEDAGGVDESVLKEFEETAKRDEFLAKELEDLKKAAESLKGAFEELESRIAKDFESGLYKINKLFGEFFQEIFGGGKAEIKMERPENKKRPSEEDLEEGWQEDADEPEEPGLEITVDIPRKRIKSLMMLSGGERALTSIALLFAMSTTNPPPFLVLDETDAALDEANSAKYAAMLKELGKKTQLIVVTHNRETMKAADVLYGVTMGGDGVSKLLSIKFEEAEGVLAKKN